MSVGTSVAAGTESLAIGFKREFKAKEFTAPVEGWIEEQEGCYVLIGIKLYVLGLRCENKLIEFDVNGGIKDGVPIKS